MWKIIASVPKLADAQLVFTAGREARDVPRSGHAVPHLSQPGAPAKAAQTVNPVLGYRQTDTRTQNWPSRSAAKPHCAAGDRSTWPCAACGQDEAQSSLRSRESSS